MTDWKRDWPPERLAERSGMTAEYVSVDRPVTYDNGTTVTPIQPRTIIVFDLMCLVESVDDPENWWMGSYFEDGTIQTWGQYGSLEDAIDAM